MPFVCPQRAVFVTNQECARVRRASSSTTAAVAGGELLLGGRRSDVAPEKTHLGEREQCLGIGCRRFGGSVLEPLAERVQPRGVLVIVREPDGQLVNRQAARPRSGPRAQAACCRGEV